MDPASLDNLHDIVVLAPVPWWPPAPGWDVVGAVLLFAFGWGVWVLLHRWRGNRYRRVALAELDRLEMLLRDDAQHQLAITQLPALVKRITLAAWPRNRVAPLCGQEWLEFLDSTGHTTAFTDGPGRLLPALAYSPRTAASLDQAQIEELFAVVRTWIKKHRASEMNVANDSPTRQNPLAQRASNNLA